VEKKGSFFSYEGKLIAQGREAAKSYLAENEKFTEELEKESERRFFPALRFPRK